MTTSTPLIEKREKLPVEVTKPIPLEFDLGNLTAFDPNPLDPSLYADAATRDALLLATVRDGAQALVNQVLTVLPIKATADGVFVELPEPVSALPREKPVPKEREMTKWEAFAKKKGIAPKERDGKLVYDEATGEWVPKWGYKGANKATESQWLVEVDDKKASTDADAEVDPRKMSRDARKKAVKVNERQQKKNEKHALLGPKGGEKARGVGKKRKQ
ncbi:regulator of ribosome synthesis [Geopyxis carbonaria]|nr:regulator of ribosome synthesis [Geopyxis carbonaria]